MIHDNM
jgi:ditrans,polycis-polyprenyl diphosphate synthase